MKILVWISIVLAAFVLQTTVSFLGVSPNITVLLAYYLGIRHGEVRGMFAGMIIGIAEDSIALSLIGPHMLSKAAIGFLSSRLISGGFFRWTPLLGLFSIIAFTAIDNSLVFFSKTLFERLPADPSGAVYITIMQALLNAVAGIFIKPAHAD